MRFAGSKVEDFLSGRPNMGKLSQQGSGLTTGKASNTISDPTSTFDSLSGPGGALEGGVYDYWG